MASAGIILPLGTTLRVRSYHNARTTAPIVHALLDGPKLASELMGPLGMLAYRVRCINVTLEKDGCGFHIVGRRVHAPVLGVRTRTVLYSLERLPCSD